MLRQGKPEERMGGSSPAYILEISTADGREWCPAGRLHRQQRFLRHIAIGFYIQYHIPRSGRRVCEYCAAMLTPCSARSVSAVNTPGRFSWMCIGRRPPCGGSLHFREVHGGQRPGRYQYLISFPATSRPMFLAPPASSRRYAASGSRYRIRAAER